MAPLNWGLGHATRCIPIICGLLTAGFNVILASDGASLLLLKKEFPELDALELPSYNITYPKKGNNFKWHMLLKLPFIWKPIAAEKKIIAQLVAEGKIQGIISDNRLGARNAAIPSVCITHQVHVLSGNTTYWSSKLHEIRCRLGTRFCRYIDKPQRQVGTFKRAALSNRIPGPIEPNEEEKSSNIYRNIGNTFGSGAATSFV